MKQSVQVLVALLLLLIASGVALAADQKTAPATKGMQTPADVASQAVDSFTKGCEQELSTFCKDVTPGEGRLLACLYAHGDKLSGRCEYAMYDAATQLERYLNNLSYLANECGDDLEKLCAGIEPGQGRLLQCLDKNQEKLSGRCKQAFKDIKSK